MHFCSNNAEEFHLNASFATDDLASPQTELLRKIFVATWNSMVAFFQGM